jgi:hypothetical protein
MALGSAPALAAYSVTQHNGTVTVAVNRPSGLPGRGPPGRAGQAEGQWHRAGLIQQSPDMIHR